MDWLVLEMKNDYQIDIQVPHEWAHQIKTVGTLATELIIEIIEKYQIMD